MGEFASSLAASIHGDHEFAGLARSIANEMEAELNQWIAELRAKGVKAAHPDDGWVDRKNNTVLFQYPDFNDGAGIGDLVALGWPQWGSRRPQTRIVRLTGVVDNAFGMRRWRFEEHDRG